MRTQKSIIMKMKYSILIAILVIIASAFTIKNMAVSEVNKETLEIEAKEWTSLEEAIKLSQKDQKKILVDIYTDWCKWCKVMDQKTFSNARVTEYLSKNYHLAKFNAEQKEEVLFKGKKFKFQQNGRRGYHEFAAEALNGRLGYPSLVVFDSNLNKIEVIRGYKSAEELLTILQDSAS